MSGAFGFIGRPLSSLLQSHDHEVVPLVREKRHPGQISWQEVDQLKAIEGFDAVIHLAGESIASSRWTEKKKQAIFQSRVDTTFLLARHLSKLENPPSVFISPSAVGYYGDRGEEEITDDSSVGKGFLAKVCDAWEMAAEPLEHAGVRVLHPRLGMVLNQNGGALKPMLSLFRLGLGGKLGSGEQWMSWISLKDLLSLMLFALHSEELSGSFLATTPFPLRQKDFAKELAVHLNRPAFLHLPKWLLCCILGEMAEALLFQSTRAHPKRLLESGFSFKHPSLQEFLKTSVI